MHIRLLVPRVLTEYVRLVTARMRYPDRMIDSFDIHQSVALGTGCRIARDVELWAGVAVGDFSYVNRGTIIGSGSIGRYCSIAYACQIGMPQHPMNFASTSPYLYGNFGTFNRDARNDEFGEPPVIGHDVWIGSGAHVLQGVTVGHGAVIGAGSVVSRDVEPYAVVAGVPARRIRWRFDEWTRASLLEMEWWNWTPDKTARSPRFFTEPLEDGNWMNKLTTA